MAESTERATVLTHPAPDPTEQDLFLIDETPQSWQPMTPAQRQRAINNIAATKADGDDMRRKDDERRSRGRYSLIEAANMLALKPATLCGAAQAGALRIFGPGSNDPRNSDSAFGLEEAYWFDLNEWLSTSMKHISFRFPEPDDRVLATVAPSPMLPSGDTWQEKARGIADVFFDADTEGWVRDSLDGYAGRVAERMQEKKIYGPRGNVLAKGTIKREALQGQRWWQGKKK